MNSAFAKLSVGRKLFIGFGSILIVLVVISTLSYLNFSKQKKAIDWNNHTNEVLLRLDNLLGSMVDMETGQRGYALTGDERSLEPYRGGNDKYREHFEALKILTADNPKQQDLLDRMNVLHNEWQAIAEEAIAKRADVAAGTAPMEDVLRLEQEAKGKASFDAFRQAHADSVAIETSLLQVRAAESEQLQSMTSAMLVVGTLLAVAIGAAIASMIARMITRPIGELKEAAEQIAQGNLNIAIDIRSKDEIGMLAQSFTAMTDSMNEVLHNISNASEQVASGSRQVSEASQELSQGSTEQASSIQQLTASMERIASQTKRNAANAEQANMLALSASADAEQGNGRMKEMLSAMEQINESSGNISKIIKVIDEIAFQTNILALNAAVEAARAGQHGKGFAVVAEEVRNLAARSANAAKETTVLIEGSIKKVEAGTRIANETAQALEKIVGGVGKAADLVGSIASASNEQAAGIQQANQGIARVSEVIQANSATSEECAAASEELSGQSEQLKEMIGKFRLKRSGASFVAGYDSFAGGQAASRRAAFAPAYAEVAAASAGKPKIRLDDEDFGKY